MNRNRTAKQVSYTLAAGIMAGTAALTGTAAPLAGASAVLSSAKVDPASEDASSSTSSADSYSTTAGVTSEIARMVASANTVAVAKISSSATALVASGQTGAAQAAGGTAAASTDTASMVSAVSSTVADGVAAAGDTASASTASAAAPAAGAAADTASAAGQASAATASAGSAGASSISTSTASVNTDWTAAAETAAAAPASEFSNIAVSQVSNYVNVRSAASEDSEVVGKLYNNCAAKVEATEGDWYKITSGNCTGYVKSEFVVVGDEALSRSVGTRYATVTTETLYVRKEPSTDATCLGMVPGGDDLVVTDESMKDQGWVKVSFEDGEAYVSADYVELSTEYKYAETVAEEKARLEAEEAEKKAAAKAAEEATKKSSSKSSSSSSSSSSGSKSYSAPSGSGGSSVVAYAKQFVGNPYVYGGTSLTNGADCSGFVMSVYKQFGVSLPHSSRADRSVGYAVSTSEMQPGDIVCYSGHVAIYAGNGQIVHAQSKRTGIVVSNVGSSGKILAVRRIF